jgi:excisionase family DNA binding protein
MLDLFSVNSVPNCRQENVHLGIVVQNHPGSQRNKTALASTGARRPTATTGDALALASATPSRRPGAGARGRVCSRTIDGVRHHDVDAPLLTPAEVAAHCRVSTKTVLRAIRSGALRAARLGTRGAYRVEPADVDAWIAACQTFGARSEAAARSPSPPTTTPPRRTAAGGRLFLSP